MGPDLSRRFMSFGSLVPPESLPEKKLRTIGVEEALSLGARGGRPAGQHRSGYLTARPCVMATAKDFAHRIPLAKGIYAHLEFLFTRTGVQTLDWTYPDLRRESCQAYFRSVRELYLGRLRGRPD